MEKVAQVFLWWSVAFSNHYRPVSKLPFCTQFFAVSYVNVSSASRASARLWLCSSRVIKFFVLGLAQRSGKIDASSAKSCSWSFSTIQVELFVAWKNWAQGVQSHPISWLYSLQPAPQSFQLWVWSRAWIWLRKNYLASLSGIECLGEGERVMFGANQWEDTPSLWETHPFVPHSRAPSSTSMVAAQPELWYARVLPRREMERWNFICEQSSKESGFPPEMKKKNLDFASTSPSTFQAALKPFRV